MAVLSVIITNVLLEIAELTSAIRSSDYKSIDGTLRIRDIHIQYVKDFFQSIEDNFSVPDKIIFNSAVSRYFYNINKALTEEEFDDYALKSITEIKICIIRLNTELVYKKANKLLSDLVNS